MNLKQTITIFKRIKYLSLYCLTITAIGQLSFGYTGGGFGFNEEKELNNNNITLEKLETQY